ncbi:Mss4p nuclear export [Microbotryomycetes sp. JL201]|nr:Mss4p nuclear export [Microbotryomycetes sp. JL201]
MAPTASKRKAEQQADPSNGKDGDSDGDSDVEMIDVSFEFFDPQPQDYHSIKLLLTQLLSGDAVQLDVGSIADLIVEQKLVGTTVKTDGGNESDPYAILSVLNLNVHKDRAGVKDLVSYLLSKASANKPFHDQLSSLLSNKVESSTASERSNIGLVLCERLVNMPAQIVPPMYKMLGEELQWAKDDGEPYHFSHLLFLSRVFLASMAELEDDPNAALMADGQDQLPTKKGGKKKAKKGDHVASSQKDAEQTWMYHPEDEVIARFAEYQQVFAYTHANKQSATEQEAFGVMTKGQMLLVPWTKYDEMVQAMSDYLQ